MVFGQIFAEREYRCLDHLRGVGTVIDAGANVGYSAAYFLSRWPEAKVFALEPDEQNFEVLTRNLAPWEARATCLKVALWSHQTELDFRDETKGKGKEWGRQVKAAPAGNVRAVDVPYLLAAYGIDTIDLLKVDIEGAEMTVFRSAPWLDAVKNIVIELHGEEERRIFLHAIHGRRYSVSNCGELTVCLSQTSETSTN